MNCHNEKCFVITAHVLNLIFLVRLKLAAECCVMFSVWQLILVVSPFIKAYFDQGFCFVIFSTNEEN